MGNHVCYVGKDFAVINETNKDGNPYSVSRFTLTELTMTMSGETIATYVAYAKTERLNNVRMGDKVYVIGTVTGMEECDNKLVPVMNCWSVRKLRTL